MVIIPDWQKASNGTEESILKYCNSRIHPGYPFIHGYTDPTVEIEIMEQVLVYRIHLGQPELFVLSGNPFFLSSNEEEHYLKNL